MSSYRELAPFYDMLVGERGQVVAFLEELIGRYAPRARSVMEMACGTGTVIAGLSSAYEVSGFDLSPEMVDRARAKLPGADIRVADMCDCDLGRKFDVVLCVYDSINHLSSWVQWCAAFVTADAHLVPGGLFIMDLNTPQRHGLLASTRAHSRPIGNDHMRMEATLASGRFQWTVQVFERDADGRFTLHTAVVNEASFPLEKVLEELSKTFDVVDVVDANGLDEDDENWRPFIISRKTLSGAAQD